MPVTPSHSLIFNKFNLVDDHLILVTNEFESQDSLLTKNDMEACWKCVSDLDGLAFFNAGRFSGASQPHKHLQFVRKPLLEDFKDDIPFEKCILGPHSANASKMQPFVNMDIPFYNVCVLLPDQINSEDNFPDRLHTLYLEMITMMESVVSKHDIPLPVTYNFLITKNWMMSVPRCAENVENTSISINSLGFAGTLFVKSTENLEVLKSRGPMQVLKSLTLPHHVATTKL